ncbi:hypothetical protein CsSME_00048454 [Camellia sinensis var. sinensis]
MTELTSESATSQPVTQGASPSLTIFLKSKGNMGYVDGRVQAPSITDRGYDQWEITNSLIMGWLIHSTIPEIGEGYLSMDTAQDIWEAVATTMRRVVVLLCFRLPLLIDLPYGRGDRSSSQGGRYGQSRGRGPNARAHHSNTVEPQSTAPVDSSADISGFSTSELEVALRHLLDRRASSSSSGNIAHGRHENGLYILDQADKLDYLGVSYEGQM